MFEIKDDLEDKWNLFKLTLVEDTSMPVKPYVYEVTSITTSEQLIEYILNLPVTSLDFSMVKFEDSPMCSRVNKDVQD